MNRNYIFLTLLMLILAFGTLIFRSKDVPDQIEPDELLQEVIQPTRYVTTDQVAKMIIQGDPSLMLIDVRGEDDFQKYSIQPSLNIPLEKLLTDDNLAYFGVPGTKVVFVSEDDIKADQAWVLIKRLGFNSTYVMEGGMNRWVETIIQPKRPAESASSSDFEIYQARKGAQMYFTGAKVEEQESSGVKVNFTRRERDNVVSGGC